MRGEGGYFFLFHKVLPVYSFLFKKKEGEITRRKIKGNLRNWEGPSLGKMRVSSISKEKGNAGGKRFLRGGRGFPEPRKVVEPIAGEKPVGEKRVFLFKCQKTLLKIFFAKGGRIRYVKGKKKITEFSGK